MIVAAIAAVILVVAVQRGALSEATIVLLAVLVPSVILHEVSHGVVALWFGDDTAKRAGRLSLNPIRHVDVMGTLILPAILIIATGTAFGYAKPVPVNPRRMRSPRNHGLVVSLAGPAVNVVLAAAAGLAAGALFEPPEIDMAVRHAEAASLLAAGLVNFGLINVILAAFNLIPLPPLDGSAIVERFLPDRLWPAYARIRPYSMGIVFLLVLFLPGGFAFVFLPAIRLWQTLLW